MSEIYIRGIDARTMLAKANVQLTIHGNESEEYLYAHLDAVIEADALGYCECSDPSICDSPALFKGEAELTSAWESGWDRAAVSAEMANCPGCQTGDPCSSHG